MTITFLHRFLSRFDLPLLMLGLVAFALSACEMTSPSFVNTDKIEVKSQAKRDMVPVAAFTPVFADRLAADYDRYGKGPVDITVTYPAGKTATQAEQHAARVATLLKSRRVSDVDISTLPVNDAASADQIMIHYTRVTAKVSDACKSHPGDDHAGLAASEDGQFPDYRFGCGIDSYVVQQVYRPSDLLGSDQLDPADAERSSARMKDYRDGKDIKELKNPNASEAKY